MKTRIVTAAILLAAVAILLLLPTSLPLAVACALLASRAWTEASSLRGFRLPALLAGFLTSAMVMTCLFAPPPIRSEPAFLSALCVFATFAGVALTLVFRAAKSLPFTFLYTVAPFCGLVLLYRLTPPTEVSLARPLLMALVPVWAGDTAGYLVGRAIGRHLLAPNISPNKTVEGSVGYLFASVLFAWALASPLGVPTTAALLCGAAAGTLGQLGDLYESFLKRRADVKDSGALFPGHGGVLDRIDGLLFAAPIACLVLSISVGR